MNLFLVTIILAFVLSTVKSAPAVSSVHVSFVSGNKATQYSHGTGGSASTPLVHYNLIDEDGEIGHHGTKRRRSVGTRQSDIGESLGTATTTSITFTDSTTEIQRRKPRLRMPLRLKLNYRDVVSPTRMSATVDDVSTDFPTTTSEESEITDASIKSPSVIKKLIRSRVKFLKAKKAANTDTLTKEDRIGNKVEMSEGSLLTELSASTADALKNKGKKPKDSKAVKRSPFIAENFDAGGITFPDFDDFGGDEFGSLRNFAGSPGGGGGGGGHHRGSLGSHTHANPESLSPDGVFLPPLPTEASDYSDNDPYLSDPDTAKYAAQHPPFFAAFPHKRAVISLNEQRVHNGLEPNILRSIRPYFAFFEAANDHRGHRHINEVSDLDHHPYQHHHYEDPHHHQNLDYDRSDSPPIYSHSPQHSTSYAESSRNFLNNIDPNVILYSESGHQHLPTTWSIFNKK